MCIRVIFNWYLNYVLPPFINDNLIIIYYAYKSQEQFMRTFFHMWIKNKSLREGTYLIEYHF